VDADHLLAACSYDRNIFGLWSYDSLAYCHFKLGHFSLSERCYAEAERLATDKLQYTVKRQLASAHALRSNM
jgi:hypothetical protein